MHDLGLPADQPVTIVQLTDLHLPARLDTRLVGMDTLGSFQAVLAMAGERFPSAAACLLTGDLADEASATAYQRLQSILESAPWPCFWLPGNHDDAAYLQRLLAGRAAGARALRAGGWGILMLDTSVPGEVGGELGEAELTWLVQSLKQLGSDTPVLVALHHHPVPCGCDWLDGQQVRDADRFWTVLADYPNVRVVLWGHIHQEVDRWWDGTRLLASPSTCVQFAPDQPTFRLDRRPPGFRWLTLYPDGTLDTGVLRLPDGRFQADYSNVDGY